MKLQLQGTEVVLVLSTAAERDFMRKAIQFAATGTLAALAMKDQVQGPCLDIVCECHRMRRVAEAAQKLPVEMAALELDMMADRRGDAPSTAASIIDIARKGE